LWNFEKISNFARFTNWLMLELEECERSFCMMTIYLALDGKKETAEA
jgi:hypothetical protein